MKVLIFLLAVFVLTTNTVANETNKSESYLKCESAVKKFFTEARDSADFDERKSLLQTLSSGCSDLEDAENGESDLSKVIGLQAEGIKRMCSIKVTRIIKNLNSDNSSLAADVDIEAVDSMMTYCFANTSNSNANQSGFVISKSSQTSDNDKKMELLEKELEAKAEIEYNKNKGNNENSESENSNRTSITENDIREAKEAQDSVNQEEDKDNSNDANDNDANDNDDSDKEDEDNTPRSQPTRRLLMKY